MKKFTRIEPTIVQEIGRKFKRQAVVKMFQTDDGLKHEFTTMYQEGTRAAGVIALTPDKQVVSVFQFRPGSEQWVYDLAGGEINSGEDARDGAMRELHEETGYVPGEITYLGKSYGDAYSNVIVHYYLATNCVLAENGASLDVEETEQGVEVRLISISDLIDNAKNSAMADPRAVLMAYDKLKELEGK